MCTLVLLRRPGHDWPLIVAANRDEMNTRPWKPPGRWWDDRPEVVAGLDELAGGTWLGVNDTGVMAAILNRIGTLGPAPGKRSRGELVLEALEHADAADAAQALAELNGDSYRSFNMVVADNRDAFWVRADGRRVEVHPIAPGLHMLSALDLDDRASPRIAAYLDRFGAVAAPMPDPSHAEGGDWAAWQTLMADTGGCGPDGEETPAMCFLRPDGFGTVSASLIALPAPSLAETGRVWRFAAGRPDQVGYSSVEG
ncbi:NRDE family protein [Magnetospirillum sp. 15-1]|uniref:NRDE family protein n=1 Tax=Magnetospirillum sp. 15-1 TaxID=1979370 RepID=UPI000BBBC3E1|nr:NRDE family protein [Magnetospirillum sp. 15-1]